MTFARLTFRARLLLIIALVITATGTVRVAVEIFGIEQRIDRELNSEAEAAVHQGAKSLTTALWELNRDQAIQILGGLALNPDFHSAVVTDQVGGVFVRLGAEKSSAGSDVSATADIFLTTSAEPRLIGALTVVLSRDRIAVQQQAAAVSHAIGAVVDVIAVFLAALIGVYLITRPVEAITAAMLRVANGAMDSPTPYLDRRDQLGALARAVEAFRSEIGRRKGVEEELRIAHSQLEARIAERTAELRSLNTRLQDLIDASPQAIVSIDDGFRILAWNPAAERIFGYTPSEVIGQPYPLVPEGEWSEFERLFRRVVAGERLQDIPLQRRTKGGRILDIISSIAPLYDDARRPIGTVSVLDDVTEKNKLQKQLAQAQKMEAVGQLTGGIAHDFNNILAVVIGNLDLVIEDMGNNAAVKPLAAAALDAAMRGAQLVHRLLAFSRNQPLQPRLLDLGKVVTMTEPLLRRSLGEQITIETRIGDDLWTVMADPGQFENAVLNLAINARDAMPEGGRLTISCANATLDEAGAVAGDSLTGEYVTLTVSDTGVGIPPDILSRVFEPFFTTKEVGKGSGLGLSMVYGYARQSGGTVKIYSEVGHGTEVRIYLPRAAAAGSATVPVDDSVKEFPMGNERILVVEDKAEVRHMAVRLLQSLGYHTVEADLPAAALAILDRGETFDLLFTDIVMPGPMNGVGLAREVRRRFPDMRVVFTSGFSDPETIRIEATALGATLIGKPYRKLELAERLRVVLDERATVRS